MRRPFEAVAVTPRGLATMSTISTGQNNRGVLRDGGVEQRNRRLARIDGEIAVTQQRGGSRDAESRAQRAAIEERAGEPRRLPRLVLPHQPVAVERIAGEIERVRAA